MFEIDPNGRVEDEWERGLANLIWANADVTLVVEGLAAPVSGTLAFIGSDRFLVVDERDEADTGGSVTLVPVDRVVSVRAPYRVVDREAERRARVGGDKAFLARVRELAELLVDQVTPMGGGFVKGAMPRDLRKALREGGFDDDPDSIAVALEILMERGDLPAASTVLPGHSGTPR